jgi:hypothetical protein
MSSAVPTVRGQELSGHNRISTQALTSLAKAAAARFLGVEAEDVRADWADDDGFLALSIITPISIPPLNAVVLDPSRVEGIGGSIRDRTVRAKAGILATVTELSGATVSRVDIRITGVEISEGGRVR